MPPQITKQTNRPIPTQISKSEDPWGAINTIRMLVYGESGSGKSTFASTFPDPLLWLLCSGGNKPGELRSIDTPENRKRITPKIITDTQQLRDYVAEANKYATVVLDHASGLADLVLKEILGLDEIPAQKGWGLATQQQYGQLAAQCKEWFRALLNLSGHVVVIAQQRTFGGKDDGGDPELIKPTVGAALTPSLAGWLNPATDFVVQTFKRPKMKEVITTLAGKEHKHITRDKGVEFCLRCEPHDVFMTKFRVPKTIKIPDIIVDPTYDSIIKVIRGEYRVDNVR